MVFFNVSPPHLNTSYSLPLTGRDSAAIYKRQIFTDSFIRFSANSKIDPVWKDIAKLQQATPEALSQWVQDYIKQKTALWGTSYYIYKSDQFPTVLLRIDKNIADIECSKPLVINTVSYPDELKKNPSLGLPLAVIQEINDKTNKYIPYHQALDRNFIQLVRFCEGDHPQQHYAETVASLEKIKRRPQHLVEDVPSIFKECKTLAIQHQYVGKNEKAPYIEKFKTFMEDCRQGKEIKGPYDTSEVFSEEIVQRFYKAYTQLITQYLETIHQYAQMPQSTFNEAVQNLKLLEDHHIGQDLTHPSNILIDTTDTKNPHIRFIDFHWDDSTEQSIGLRINNLAKIMLGSGYLWVPALIANDNDNQQFKGILQALINKLETAAQSNDIEWNSQTLKNSLNQSTWVTL